MSVLRPSMARQFYQELPQLERMMFNFYKKRRNKHYQDKINTVRISQKIQEWEGYFYYGESEKINIDVIE